MLITINLLKNKSWFSVAIMAILIMSSILALPAKAEPLWSNVDSINTASHINARTLSLDKEALQQKLIPPAKTRQGKASQSMSLPISLPLPQGGEVSLMATPTTVLPPELAEQFPEIKTWKVIGKDNAIIHGRIDLTKQGFHAMLIISDGDTVYIEPDKTNVSQNYNRQQYLSFSKRSNHAQFKNNFSCGVNKLASTPLLSPSSLSLDSLNRTLARPASQKIIYRLAVAATGEYTQYHGGSKANALSAIVTTINRVNGIYEQDLGVEFILIAQQADIIYIDPDTDPYTKNDIDAMLEENLLNLSDEGDLSKSLYDIGHLFGAGSVGGLAALDSVCNPLLKAAGVTGVPNPESDAFNIDYVAHELGHQLGATHTFNSQCGVGNQREQTTAVEPGSGSTIMSYAGVCGSNNLQAHTDPQFHARSIAQISNNIRNNSNNQCGSRQGQTNQNPIVDAGKNSTMPVLTPFMLKATASDPDGDALSYTWEQIDAGKSTNLDIDSGDNALFRSRPASTSSTRYIPRLSDLFKNTLSDGEPYIANARLVKFVITARDSKGGIAFDEITKRFVSTGDLFQVSTHKNAETLFAGDTTRVSWRVAGTNIAPINCQNIEISLIQSNGTNVIINTSQNDGDELVLIPESITPINNARIMVSCADHTFFKLSLGRLKVSSRDTGGTNDGEGGGALFSILLPLFIVRLFRKRLINMKRNMKKIKQLSSYMLISIVLPACTEVPSSMASKPHINTPSNYTPPNYSIGNIKQKREAEYAQKLSALKRKNPVNDAHNEAAKGKAYLWVYQSGRGGITKAPGLSEAQLANNTSCSIRQIAGLGDMIYGETHLKYRVAIRKYANQFNKVMLRYCR